MSKLVLVSLVISLIGCTPGHHQSVRVDSGLPYDLDRSNLIFINDLIGFMGGTECKEGAPTWGEEVSADYWYKDACCYRTLDGGVTWKRFYITNADLRKIVEKDGILYAQVTTKTKESNYQGKIYVSSDWGETWRWKCDLPGCLLDLHVMDSNWLFVNDGGHFFETKDGGKYWKNIKDKNFLNVYRFFNGDTLYYFSGTKNNFRNHILIRKDLETKKIKHTELPDGYDGIGGCGNIILCAKEKSTRVYRVNDDLTLTRLHTFHQRIVLEYAFQHGEQIILFVFYPRSPWFYPLHAFLYSPNGGKRWFRLRHEGCYAGNYISTYLTKKEIHVRFYTSSCNIGIYSFPRND